MIGLLLILMIASPKKSITFNLKISELFNRKKYGPTNTDFKKIDPSLDIELSHEQLLLKACEEYNTKKVIIQ